MTMLRFRFCQVTLLAIALLTTSCKQANKPVSGATQFHLTPNQVTQLEKEGPTNASAAFRLYEHFFWAEFDTNNAVLWLRRAATGGHPVAQYNLGVVIRESGGKPEEYRKWFSLAASQGNDKAIEVMNALEQSTAGQMPAR